MANENSIGLAELIEEVKRELLTPETNEDGEVPFFSVDSVTLELQVTVHKEASGGIKIYVLQLGGKIGNENAQKVQVTLTPLLSKDERVQLYKQRYPNLWQAIERANIEGGLKGSESGSLEDTFND